MKQQFTYDDYSKTIRLMPQNYLVAEHEKGHYISDPDAAIDDKLATRIFLKLRSLKFSNDLRLVLSSLNALLSVSTDDIKNEMGNYLCNDTDEYDKLIKRMLLMLHKKKGNAMLESVKGIEVWEKVDGKFTVKEFCDLIGINIE